MKNAELTMGPCVVTPPRPALLTSDDGSHGHGLERGSVQFITLNFVGRLVD